MSIESFLEWLLGSHARAIVLGIGAVGTFIGAIVAVLEYRRRRRADDKVELLDRELRVQRVELEKKQVEVTERGKQIEIREAKLDLLRHAVLRSEDQLWRLYEPQFGFDHPDAIARGKPIVITIGNLKGGVGKTTLTANLAAYFDQRAGKRVLVVDLDYQGSLSSMMLSAAKVIEVPSQVNRVLDGSAGPANHDEVAIPLHASLPKTSIIPAFYPLAPLENRVMIEWLLKETHDDARYRLAKFIYSGEVSARYDVILLDVPPRLTTGTINALCASTHLLVPTIFDRVSAEAVGTFLNAVKSLKAQLNPQLDLLGVVGTFVSQKGGLNAPETSARLQLEKQLPIAWKPNQVIFQRTIPRRVSFSRAAGEAIAYLDDADVRGWMDELGSEIRQRLGL